MSDILNPLSFPLQGTHLIEASAGTGKTYTIAALYVRLVLQHGGEAAFSRPLAPQNILVVTFTNAATEELRDRIRRRLAEAALVFRALPNAPRDPLLQELRDSYPESQWPALARRLELASSSMDEAAVHTIHGWAQRMLSQYAFDSGSRFNLRLEADDRELYQEAARDYWRTFVYPLAGEELSQVLACVDCPDSLAASIRQWPDLAAKPDAGLEFLQAVSQWSEQYGQLQERSRRLWLSEASKIDAWFEQALEKGWLHGASHKPEPTRELLAELHAWAAGEDLFKAERHGKLSATGLRLTKKAEPPTLEAFQAIADLVDCCQQAPEIGPDLFGHAKAWCERRVEQAKQRRAELSFDDLLRRLDAALQGPNGPVLAESIRRSYPVALIDEFQDTDPVQYRMFRTLYLGRPGLGLFMIGDPKQAIYAFRGADIHTYLQARRDTQGKFFTLDTNYRSTHGLVDAVNTLFKHADRLEAGAFLFKDEIPFTPVNAKGRREQLVVDGQALPAMTFWYDLDPRNKTAYLSDMAAVTASQIVQLLQGGSEGRVGFDDEGVLQPLHSSDIAILVRDRTEAEAIRQALSERGLRSAYLSDRESVYNSAEARDLLLWLRAVNQPESETCLRVALASPTLDMPLSELDTASDHSQHWEGRVEQFLLYRRLWQRKGLLVMLTRLLDDFQLPARLLQKAESGGERSLTNLMQLGELLQQASIDLDGEQALLRYFQERIEEAKDSRSEDYVQRLESDEALIKVVTIHKSKGLEYPLVFLPFIGTSRPVDRNGRLFFSYHDETGRRCFDYELTDEGKAYADRERLAEDLRLLYVAVTRARHACWLAVSPLGKQNKNSYSCQLRFSALGQILNGGERLEPEILTACLKSLQGESTSIAIQKLPEATTYKYQPIIEAPELEPARQAVQRAGTPWWITSYSGVIAGARMAQGEEEGTSPFGGLAEDPAEAELILAEDSAAQAVAEELLLDAQEGGPLEPGGEEHSLHRFPKGARAGIFLHGLLEWATRQGFSQLLSAPEPLQDQVARRCRARGLDDWAEPLLEWLLGFLDTPLPLPHGSSLALGQLDTTRAIAELEFWFSVTQTDSQQLDRLLHQQVAPGQRRPQLLPQTLNGMLKGYIDLVFEHDGRYYVADYKSNWLGPDTAAYTPASMEAAMLEHRYDLQLALYSLALHRLLRARIPNYDYDRHFGGVLYLFLRGVASDGSGVYRLCPPRSFIDALDRLFASRALQGGQP